MAIKAEHDRLSSDPPQRNVDSEFLVIAPKPAAIDLRPIARDKHHLAQFFRIDRGRDIAAPVASVASARVGSIATPTGAAIERSSSPIVAGINDAAAIACDGRSVFHIY